MAIRRVRKSDLADFDFPCLGEQIAADFAKVAYYAQCLSDEKFWDAYPEITIKDLEFIAEAINYISEFKTRLFSTNYYNILNEE